VRFEGATASRKLTTGQGLQFYEIGLKFAIQPSYDLCATSSSAASKDFVGWNRAFNPKKGWWEALTYQVPTIAGIVGGVRYAHLYDEDFVDTVTAPNGRQMKGMQQLFWAGAA